ncbi:MAG: alanine racemase [Chloroflexi bacterium]|nr:alanine racemase [Chloroflexota bacterium]
MSTMENKLTTTPPWQPPKLPFRDKPNWAEVDLDAIAYNTRQIKRWIGEKVELMAVVKGDGYGHGAVMVARTALQNGATRLATARVDEAIQLRQAGITVPIFVLGYVPVEEMEAVVKWRIDAPIMHWDIAVALSQLSSKASVITPVHVKVDTGMGRFGLMPDEVANFVEQLLTLPGLRFEGLYTQFATADEKDKTYTYQQFAIYKQVLQNLQDKGISVPIRHVANSPTTLDLPEAHLDMVRCGTVIYGLYPSPEVDHSIPLKPALMLKSRVARLQTLPAGWGVSYGRTYIPAQPIRAALVPLGFGDGFRRALSNIGYVLIRGKRAPVIGRICMDQCIVNVSDIPEIERDDEVVLIGKQGNEEISADLMAETLHSIHYEVLTAISARVPRVYIQNGEIVAIRTLSGLVPDATPASP